MQWTSAGTCSTLTFICSHPAFLLNHVSVNGQKLNFFCIWFHLTICVERPKWKAAIIFVHPLTVQLSEKTLLGIDGLCQQLLSQEWAHSNGKTRQSQNADSTPGVATWGLLWAHVIFLLIYTQGHYLQTWCHKYSTRPLWPSRPWLQQVVLSVHCLQWVFQCTVCVHTCESHCLSLAVMLSSQLAYVQIWPHPQNRKYITYHYAATEGPSHGYRQHAQKIWWKLDA